MSALLDKAKSIYEIAHARPVGRLPLHEFAFSGRVIPIYSEVLREIVLLAADDADMDHWLLEHPKGADAVVYRAREMMLLTGITQSGLSLLHEVKSRFQAEIEADDLIPLLK